MTDYSDFTITLPSTTVAAAAANADAAGAYVVAPFAGRVTAASFVAAAATTGANTDSRTYQIHNRGQAGAGTTLVASRALLLATDNVADTRNTMTLTATVADRVVAEGDLLEVTSLHVGGTGLAGQSGIALVTFQRALA